MRRETACAYLKAPGIAVRPPGAWGRRAPAKRANEVTTDLGPPISPTTGNQDRVTSACEPYREFIQQGLSRGRNAMAIWQDLVSDHGFPHGYQSVKRFVHKLLGSELPQAVGIMTSPSFCPTERLEEEPGVHLTWIIHDFAGGKRKGALKD